MAYRICTNCEKFTVQEFKCNKATIIIRGERIECEDLYFICFECGEELSDPQFSYDVMDSANQEYRKRQRMLQFKEIRNWRKKNNLTQKELRDLLACKPKKLCCYEQRKLQDEERDRILRKAMNPRKLSRLIKDTPNVLPPKKKAVVIKELKRAKTGRRK